MNRHRHVYTSFIILEYVDHASAAIENDRHGGQHYRYLNVTGRWAARGCKAVPLLTWRNVEEAKAAALIASKARSCAVEPSSVGGNVYLNEQFSVFDDQHASALLGHLPYATAKARQLEEQRAKTMDFARAVLRVHQATT